MMFRILNWSLSPTGAVFLGLMAVALWSVSTVAEKLLLRHIPPVTLLVWQLSSSVILLWSVALGLRLPLPTRRRLWHLGWPGLVQPGIANTFFLLGLSLVSANVFSFLTAGEAPLGLIFARLLLRERLGRPVMVLAGIATLGVLAVAASVPGDGQRNTSEGILLVMCGTLFASLYAVVSRATATESDHPVVILAVQQSFSLAVVLLSWCLLAGAHGEITLLTAVSVSSWCWAALAGLAQYALPFWLFVLALRTLSASIASLLLISGPVLVVLIAFPVLGERISSLQGCGAAVTLLAMMGVAAYQRTLSKTAQDP